MKKQILTLLSILCFTFSFSQSNEDIAKVYINRAYNAIQESIDYKEALVQFNKAMEYTDTITSSKVAMLGTFIHYEVNNLEEAKSYAKQYFLLERKKSSDEYLELLGLYVTINEELEKQNAEEKRLEEERIKKEKELRKIDSLKIIWQSKSDTFSLKVDSIYTFNKKSLALFSKNGYFGIVNDLGNIIIEADTYKDALSFDGYFLLMDKSHEASQIYCYNINKKNGFLLPFPSDLNPLSTHFGKIMLPRGNGRLITYLNNSYAPLVYDLVAKKDVKVANEKELFKIILELISNSLKHAKAQRIVLQINAQNEYVHFSYEDDGVGFDTKQVSSGLGLRSIKSRVTKLEGSLNLDSKPGHGVSVVINFPIL